MTRRALNQKGSKDKRHGETPREGTSKHDFGPFCTNQWPKNIKFLVDYALDFEFHTAVKRRNNAKWDQLRSIVACSRDLEEVTEYDVDIWVESRLGVKLSKLVVIGQYEHHYILDQRNLLVAQISGPSSACNAEIMAWDECPSKTKLHSVSYIPFSNDVRAIREHVESQGLRFEKIQNPRHPAYNQFGLFASRSFRKDEYITTYLGVVTLDTWEDESSDYTLRLSDSGFAVDSQFAGNHARFINDFRNTGKKANARFEEFHDSSQVLRMGVFAIRDTQANEEILVSYGKGYWKERDLLQGQDTPDEESLAS